MNNEEEITYKRYKRYTEQECAFIREFFPLRGSRYCAKQLHRPWQSVTSTARKIGVCLTREGRTRVLEDAFAKPPEWYKVSLSQFETVTKPEVAYFLGYFWADGHVCVRHTDNDPSYVFSFLILNYDYLTIKEVLDTMGGWGIYTRAQISNGKLVTKVYTGNKPLVLWLLKYDYGSKSFGAPTKILDHIPSYLRHYFWRGYMDGDGSFRTSAVRGAAYHFIFASTFDYDWTAHSKILDELVIPYKITRTEKRKNSFGRNSVMVCSNLEGTYRWGKYIYEGYEWDGIGLKRKWDKWIVVRDRAELYQRLEAVKISEDPDASITPELLYTIILNHKGMMTRRKLVEHFHAPWWKIRDKLRVLFKQNRVKPIDNAYAKRYIVVDASLL